MHLEPGVDFSAMCDNLARVVLSGETSPLARVLAQDLLRRVRRFHQE
jgi:hypothetical protein